MNNLIEALNQRLCDELNTIFLNELSNWEDPGSGKYRKQSFRRLKKLILEVRKEGFDINSRIQSTEFLEFKYPEKDIEQILKLKKEWMPIWMGDTIIKMTREKKDKYLEFELEGLCKRRVDRVLEKIAEEEVMKGGPFFPGKQTGVIDMYPHTGNHVIDIFMYTIVHSHTGKEDPYGNCPF